MDRMKAAYEHDVASGNLAPGARFLKGALETRSGSGSAMAVNDAANSVHDVASSTGGKVVGKAAKSLIGGDPAKLIASGTTVVQAGAQALDQNDPGRNAEYATSAYTRSQVPIAKVPSRPFTRRKLRKAINSLTSNRPTDPRL